MKKSFNVDSHTIQIKESGIQLLTPSNGGWNIQKIDNQHPIENLILTNRQKRLVRIGLKKRGYQY